ncbi:MAG: hypothetical protein MR717_09250 [Prevotella sp.]|nr:hypothetical protein [Prevotella sp.]
MEQKTQKGVSRVIVNIKFEKHRDFGTLVGFTTRKNGSWMGCYSSDACKKKVVLPDKELSPALVEHVLYRTTLIPMKSKDGFVAINATPVKFNARIETISEKDGSWRIEVKFGHKRLVYDPSAKNNRHRSDIDVFTRTLSERVDIASLPMVIDDFMEAVRGHEYA